MKFTVLGSGSTGNAVLISSEKTNVLIDAGLSAKEILRRLYDVGVDPCDLDAILITHEHSDHAGGLRVLMQSIGCPVYISDITLDAFFNTQAGGKNGESESSKRKTALTGKTVAIESTRDSDYGSLP
jgi:phosphoribosyl 1,2-cyclic phosphodiesterase